MESMVRIEGAKKCYGVVTDSRRTGEIPPPAAASLDPVFARSKIEVVGRSFLMRLAGISMFSIQFTLFLIQALEQKITKGTKRFMADMISPPLPSFPFPV
jgi:hypothetical protein